MGSQTLSLQNVKDLFTLDIEANVFSAELLTAAVHKTFLNGLNTVYDGKCKQGLNISVNKS